MNSFDGNALQVLSAELKEKLLVIVHETYPGLVREPFTLELIDKEYRGKHGDFRRAPPGEPCRIRVFNLHRPEQHRLATALHEIAHLCDYLRRGTTNHGPEFYMAKRDLMAQAVRKKFIDYNMAKEHSDSGGMASLEKRYGGVLTSYRPLDVETGEKTLIKVSNAFDIKDDLKERGYRWSELELSWCIEVEPDALESEKRFLEDFAQDATVSIVSSAEASLDAVSHIVVKGAFAQNAALRAAGYKFNGYGFTGKVWVKRFPARDLVAEREYLARIGCKTYKLADRKTSLMKNPYRKAMG